jgi:hypothetical protein
MARKYGYSVSPALTNKPNNQRSMQERLDQLEMENRLLRGNASKPQRQSLVESSNSGVHTSSGYQSRNDRNRNLLQERLQNLDLANLASRETGIPENTTIEQLLRDFGSLYLYKTGHYDEV